MTTLKKRIGALSDNLTAADKEFLEIWAKFKKEDGWSDDDVIAFLRCTEEVSPELPEDVALARMDRIYEKYDNPTNDPTM